MNKATILSIDDNVYNQRLMRKILEVKAYEILTANQGEQGLAIAVNDMPDLILLDIGLPDISGFEVLKRLRKSRAATIPVIAVTAYCMSGDRQLCMSAGFAEYVAKPIMKNELYSVVESILSKHSASAQGSTGTTYLS